MKINNKKFCYETTIVKDNQTIHISIPSEVYLNYYMNISSKYLLNIDPLPLLNKLSYEN